MPMKTKQVFPLFMVKLGFGSNIEVRHMKKKNTPIHWIYLKDISIMLFSLKLLIVLTNGKIGSKIIFFKVLYHTKIELKIP